MPHVDSLLSLVHREGANELRIGTDRAPAMFANGTPKRLSIPKTSPDTLRHLMGDLLSPAVARSLANDGRAEISHEVPSVGSFQVQITKRAVEGEIDVVFLKAAKAEASTPKPSPEAPAPAPVPGPTRALQAPPSVDTAPRGPVVLPSELADLVARALALGASDVHLASGQPPMARIHGRLRSLHDTASYRTAGPTETAIAELIEPLLDEGARARIASGASLDLGVSLPLTGSEGHAPRLRINVFRVSSGIAAAIRILPREVPALEALGFAVPIGELASLPNGLVIVSGPTGCGKSTTLAALAQAALRERSIALVTLEDPIEYEFTGSSESVVRQRQIGRDVRDFPTGLRDALREDPDVILVGEMRDPESIALALTAAETGHLVLTTLHSRSAAATLERIIDACPEGARSSLRTQLADSLRAVVSQRLIPRVGGEGRVLASEILRVNTSVAASLRDAKISGVVSAMQAGRKDGMVTLERCLADLVRRREITIEAARGMANDRDALVSYLASS